MTRVRTSSADSPSKTWSVSYHTNSTSNLCSLTPFYSDKTGVLASGATVEKKFSRTMTDVVTPQFRTRSARGEIINSPMGYQIVEEELPLVSVEAAHDYNIICTAPASGSFRQYTSSVEGLAPFDRVFGSTGFIPLPSYDFDHQHNAAIAVTSAWANIGHTDILMGATMMEMNKTVDGMIGLLKRVLRIVKRLRKKQFKLLLKDAKDLRNYAELYMQARYELRPLYYDAVGLSKAVNRLMPKINDRETFRGAYHDTLEYSDQVEVPCLFGSASGLSVTADLQRNTTIEATYRAGVLTRFGGNSTGSFGLGIDSLPITIWELVPFSFIIDWFLNVGNTIEAWTPNVGSTVLTSWISQKVVYTQTVVASAKCEVTSSKISNASCNMGGIMMKKTTSYSRTPDPYRRILPSINIRMSPAKLLDLGIIISSLAGFKFMRRRQKPPKMKKQARILTFP